MHVPIPGLINCTDARLTEVLRHIIIQDTIQFNPAIIDCSKALYFVVCYDLFECFLLKCIFFWFSWKEKKKLKKLYLTELHSYVYTIIHNPGIIDSTKESFTAVLPDTIYNPGMIELFYRSLAEVLSLLPV